MTLALLLAGCAAPAAPPPAGGGPVASDAAFMMDALGCRELLVQVPVPLEAARAFVPANFTPLVGAGGRAVAFAGLKLCEALWLDGEDAGPGSTSDVGVLIEDPDGSGGLHYYQTWWVTDHPGLAARLAAMGWRSAEAGTSLSGAGPAGAASASVVWDAGAYELTGTFAAPPVPPSNLATGWHETPAGTLRVVKTLASFEVGAGPGAVDADAGPMAELLGAAHADGAALWNVYDMTGRVERP